MPSPSSSPALHLAVALDGAGWHPAAWREPGAAPDRLFTAAHWAPLVAEAEAGLLDFVTFEDSLALQSTHPTESDGRTDQVRGRLDAVLLAARLAPLTRHIGLVPSVVATHTEPFHVSKAVATLDHVSRGRAGLRIRISQRDDEARHFGRRKPDEGRAALLDEAADHIEVVRRLWDSWEDDAEIRDVATGRFVDRAKLHYADFEGRHFSVRGPSITPRPPQGQPLVTALAADSGAYPLLARAADLGYVTPRDADEVRVAVAGIRGAREAAGLGGGQPLHVFGELTVFLGDTQTAAARRLQRLDAAHGSAYTSDAPVFTGTPARLADLLLEWRAAGLTGFRLRPGTHAHDLPAITRGLVPELRRRGVFRRSYEAASLRGLLGLPRPGNRYAAPAPGPAPVPGPAPAAVPTARA
ncbi:MULTISPECIES: LLM class flavin-dependent oxidoreductase [unclassified Streptomyces]|uniref:LLM class flavin-dependent oxidoreductase n=1 Tax=unclassified Streptomyces TaxID=2593676 RepID=UPI002257EB86|nr:MULTISPECIES: LLM class flavin-dependent oxidoreductase [unclassified Streptomyces]MCX4524762.1 LLM class flavin-dependent oxidoreductase [Streptomyces sp. NBC_01551]MCX4544727.1 LLM class flavin-dependent oxidoreductase [Streptomyces sp. NBC_01565]